MVKKRLRTFLIAILVCCLVGTFYYTQKPVALTIGVFAGSNWNVPSPKSGKIIDDVIMVAGAGQEDYVTEEIVNKYHFGKVRAVISGGKERYDSVWNGLKAVRDGMAGERKKDMSISMTAPDRS